jgi:hypothetical protein
MLAKHAHVEINAALHGFRDSLYSVTLTGAECCSVRPVSWSDLICFGVSAPVRWRLCRSAFWDVTLQFFI